jgi:hypothetical protein
MTSPRTPLGSPRTGAMLQPVPLPSGTQVVGVAPAGAMPMGTQVLGPPSTRSPQASSRRSYSVPPGSTSPPVPLQAPSIAGTQIISAAGYANSHVVVRPLPSGNTASGSHVGRPPLTLSPPIPPPVIMEPASGTVTLSGSFHSALHGPQPPVSATTPLGSTGREVNVDMAVADYVARDPLPRDLIRIGPAEYVYGGERLEVFVDERPGKRPKLKACSTMFNGGQPVSLRRFAEPFEDHLESTCSSPKRSPSPPRRSSVDSRRSSVPDSASKVDIGQLQAIANSSELRKSIFNGPSTAAILALADR